MASPRGATAPKNIALFVENSFVAQYNPSKNLASKKFNHLKLPKIVHTV